jgi:hypothetical protein
MSPFKREAAMAKAKRTMHHRVSGTKLYAAGDALLRLALRRGTR